MKKKNRLKAWLILAIYIAATCALVFGCYSVQKPAVERQEFPFTLTASGMAGQTINVSTDGGLTFQERTLDNQGKTEFTLKHGDNIIFYPVAGTYTVTETDHGSYTTSYSLNGAAAVNGTSVSGTIPADGSNSVRFVNTYNVGIPTGVSTPASAALVGIIVAMAMLAVVYMGRRWKVLEE